MTRYSADRLSLFASSAGATGVSYSDKRDAIAEIWSEVKADSEKIINFAGANLMLATTFGKIMKRYAYLVSENLRNFQQSKDSIVVLTRIAWAAIVTSAHRLSQGLHLGRGIVGSRFRYIKNLSIEPVGKHNSI